MKWSWPEQGTLRTVTRFLWYPKEIGHETRFWEKATWEEKVVYWWDDRAGRDARWSWEIVRWIDDGEE